VTQQELCNATFKDKPSMTRLIDNMERQHLVVRISDKKDRRTNLIHLTKTGKQLEDKTRKVVNHTLVEALQNVTLEELTVSQEVLRKIFYNTKENLFFFRELFHS
ncbi:MAG: MarR family transcriptional regulator, partial [Bacteroides sp.]|nr:MarR family transcriptional regulator [Bacteroides sp.]